MNILVTGTRAWVSEELMTQALLPFDREKDFLIHGGAKGADTMSHLVWRKLGFVNDPDVVRPEYDYWKGKLGPWLGGKKAPKYRNILMVDGKRTQEGDVDPSLVPDITLAFYLIGKDSTGTAHCMGKAIEAGIPVDVWKDPEGYVGRL